MASISASDKLSNVGIEDGMSCSRALISWGRNCVKAILKYFSVIICQINWLFIWWGVTVIKSSAIFGCLNVLCYGQALISLRLFKHRAYSHFYIYRIDGFLDSRFGCLITYSFVVFNTAKGRLRNFVFKQSGFKVGHTQADGFWSP